MDQQKIFAHSETNMNGATRLRVYLALANHGITELRRVLGETEARCQKLLDGEAPITPSVAKALAAAGYGTYAVWKSAAIVSLRDEWDAAETSEVVEIAAQRRTKKRA